jgi:hypothetical protein
MGFVFVCFACKSWVTQKTCGEIRIEGGKGFAQMFQQFFALESFRNSVFFSQKAQLHNKGFAKARRRELCP